MAAVTDAVANGSDAPRRNIFQTLEIDVRLLGMVVALIAISLVFHFATEQNFLTPRNIFNITIQTVSVAIMATGMVFVIVTRHIDLSVGSLLATCSAVMAMFQTEWLINGLSFGHVAFSVFGANIDLGVWAIDFGLERGDPGVFILTIVFGIGTGALIGALQGTLVGYYTIPAFIVTLGGLLIWRNVGWMTTNGQTIGQLDQTFLLFGGTGGTLGWTWSWIVGFVAAGLATAGIWFARFNKIRHGFPVKPLWAEGVFTGVVIGVLVAFIAVLNAYEVPTRRLERLFAARGETMPEGYTESFGLPISVLLLVAVAVTMTVIARRTRLGRYIFATGGNPQAAELSGINTKLLTVKIFALMGALCALAAVVAQARLANHGNDIGTLDELRVIAAAVIGGTALAGGVGTIYGAILGALIMQSLQSGMAMMGVDTPYQNIIIGLVLVMAVWVDIIYRKRVGDRT